MLNIFVIHYASLNDRNENIETLKKMAGQYKDLVVNIEIITDHDPETISSSSIGNLVKIQPTDIEKLSYYNNFLKSLSPQNISNALKHFKAIQKCSKSNEGDINLIIEDDVVYSDKFFSQIHLLITKLTTLDWDVVFISQPSENVSPTNSLSVSAMNVSNTILPCCDGYVLNKSFAKELMIHFFPIHFEYNVHLSFVMNKMMHGKVYKCHPNLTGDGSKTGKFLSSIHANNVLIFNEDYKFVYSILESDSLSNDNLQKIDTIMAKEIASSNADFIYLNGLYKMKLKRYQESKDLFDKAIGLYENYGLQIDNTSSLLKNRIRLEQFLQTKLEKN
tara:strand:- start:1617 stop:2615 length:999 start_codon:yes stop_codon:yes gene_type:complete